MSGEVSPDGVLFRSFLPVSKRPDDGLNGPLSCRAMPQRSRFSLVMEVPRSSQGETVEVVFDGGDFMISPGAARVLLRIMRKAAARAVDEAGSGASADRIAS